MSEISTFRLYLLRACYALIALGLAVMIWPGIISHSTDVPNMNTAVRSLLGAVSLLSFLGLRYPLRMLPILLFELTWKAIWILSFGLPLWREGLLTGDFAETMFNCVTTVIIIPFIPWDYVYRHYIKATTDPWLSQR